MEGKVALSPSGYADKNWDRGSGKNTVWGCLQISIIWAFCFIHYHGQKLGYMYTVFQGELKWLPNSFFYLSLISTERDSSLWGLKRCSPQTAIYSYGPERLVRNALSIPLSTCCIRISILTRPPGDHHARCSVRSAGLEDRSPQPESPLSDWNKRLVGWLWALTLTLGSGHAAGGMGSP